MKKIVGMLFMLLLLFFALPPLLILIEHLIIPIIVFVFLVGLGIFLVGRKKMW